MRRLLAFLLRNWPLKLAAVGLATVLYAGVSLSENERTWPGQVPIEVLDPPQGGAVLDLPGSVTDIRYRAPLDAQTQLTNGSFLASIDLGDVTPTAGGPPVERTVRVTPLDPRIQIVDFKPRSVNVRVDQVVTRPATVAVDRGTVPDGLVLGPPQVSPESVLLRGASSRVAAVNSVVARVAVDDSGLNVDQEVDLEATDETGALVPGVEILPQRARVTIEVARELGYATLPVVPVITGQPAAGFRVSGVTAVPTTLTVSGEAPVVEQLTSIPTTALDVTGRDASFEQVVDADLPPEVSAAGGTAITLAIGIEPDQGSQTWQVGVRAADARPGRAYALSTTSVLVTLGGSRPQLDALDPATIDARVAVGRLGVGTHEVPVVVEPPDGLRLVSIEPPAIRVAVSVPERQPEPSRQPVASQPPAPGSPGPSAVITGEQTSSGEQSPTGLRNAGATSGRGVDGGQRPAAAHDGAGDNGG